jgi:2-polyprenyl-6-hydroxyphenyl methylase/3-demethylubiquinone-9 3-methyltransferase|tara:strand:- start:6 stop:713 length:708 start_codon:yes stop_codon:yes gene_type:complete
MHVHHENIDQDEIDKFNQFADQWWDHDGDNAALLKLNPLRFKYISNNSILKAKTCLDVGCGGGILTESLASKADSVVGIDMAENLLKVAKNHSKNSKLENVSYRKISIEEYSKGINKVDILTCMEMLEHVPSPEQIVRTCSESVISGGDLFFSTINRNPKSFLMAILGAEYILKIIPQGTHEYDQFIKPSELDQWGRKANLTLKELIGVTYDPFSETFNLSKNVSVNYMMHFIKN